MLGGVHQNNVLSATRQLEVAADPTILLALLAALRRADAPTTCSPIPLSDDREQLVTSGVGAERVCTWRESG